MENEAYFTIKQWRGIPEGRTLIAFKKTPTGVVEVSDPISKAIIHSCMVEIIASINLGLLVDVRAIDYGDNETTTDWQEEENF